MAERLSFRILGPLEVWRGGALVPLGAAKQRALLALLLVRRGEVARDVLIDALWGEHPPKGARNTLQVYASRVRRALGPAVLETTGFGYRLRLDHKAVDAEQFEHLYELGREQLASDDPEVAAVSLTEALALWRGPALADFHYDAFAQTEAGRLNELRLACLEERIEADLQLGRHAVLIGELEGLIIEHPLRERLRGQLILALYRAGRQSEALAQYQATRKMLADELGLEPSPELRELERMVLGHDPKLAAPDAKPRSNLPAQPTPFIGREQEVSELIQLVRAQSRRLLTLTGAGGSGKSRLAVRAACELRSEFEDGVWWVPLQSLADPGLVLPTIAAVIGAKGEPARLIGDKTMLIVLDNFEHLLEAASPTAGLLVSCPNLVLLATSREPLHVAAERPVFVPPMSQKDAVMLFRERAAHDGPDEAVAEICQRLDCLPLAVELAAARTALFPPEELAQRLGERLPLLTGGPRDAPARQQTLRATIEWSYNLLARHEQRLFARLSVFAGGWTTAAAAEVCEATLDDLEALAYKSLLVRRQGRYEMLETVHEFGEELLEDSGEAKTIQAKHAACYLGLTVQARAEIPMLQAASMELVGRWTITLERELDNLRTAFQWFVANGEREQALRMADAMPLLWGRGGRDDEAERWFREALEGEGAASDRAMGRALTNRGLILVMAGRPSEAKPSLQEALVIGRSIGDEWMTCGASRGLGWIALDAGDLEGARECFETGLAMATTADFINSLRQGLGEVELGAGDLERARLLLSQAAEDATEAGPSLTGAFSLCVLADVDRAEGLLDRAEARYRESLSLVQSAVWNRTTWTCVSGLASTALARGDLVRAGRLWGATLASLEGQQVKMHPPSFRRYASLLNGRTEPDYLCAFDEGRSLTPDEAISYATQID